MSNLIKISVWLSLSELVFNLSGYIIHALLGRILDPVGYGRFSLVITLATMIIVLIGKGVPIAMSKYLSEVKQDDEREGKVRHIRKTSMGLQLIIIAAVTAVYFFSAPVVARLLGDPSLIPLFQISSLIIPAFGLASFYVYYFVGIQQFEKQAFLKFFRSVAKVFLIVGLAYFFSIEGALIGQAAAPLLVFLVAVFLDPFRKSPKTAPVSPEPGMQKKLLNFAWVIVLFMLFYELMIHIDLYLVKGILQDDAKTGLFNAALTVGRIPYYAFYFLTIILLPKTSQSIAEGIPEKTKKLLRESFKFLFMFIFPTVAIISLFADPAIRFFYGNQYRGGAPSLEILIFGFGFLTIFYVLTFVLNGAGKNKIPLYISIFGAILNTILNVFLIKKFGLVGSAIATSITAFVIMAIALVYANKKIAYFLQPISLAKYFIASLIIYWLGFAMLDPGKYSFILWSILLLAVYLVILFALGEIGKKDMKFILASFKNKKNLPEKLS